MYLEGERAMLLRELMRLRESRGDLEGAAAASREIQVLLEQVESEKWLKFRFD